MADLPTTAELLQQGLFHHQQGQLALAMDRYTDVLRTDPNNPDALYYVAVVACQEGQFKQGAELARRAIEKGPPQARVHNLLGRAHERLGEALEAAKSYDKAISIDPKFAEAHGNRANLLVEAGLPEEALQSFDRAVALKPDSMTDWVNRGALLHTLGRREEALASFDKALVVAPDEPGIMMNRASALALLGRFAQAEGVYDQIIKINAKFAPAYAHKGLAVMEQGRFDEARALLAQSLKMNAEDHEAAYALARLMLLTGDWKNAWTNFERRASLPEPAYTPLDHPRWNGERAGGYRLVLVSEQGLGDTVQFGRYASLLAGRGYPVTLLTLPVLAPLMRTLPGVERVITSADELNNDPRPIMWLPLMSTMGALHLTPTAIPEQTAYLSVEPARVAKFKEKLGDTDLKVGILWGGVSNAAPLSVFAPLAEIPGVRLISLQKGGAVNQIGSVPFGGKIERVLDANDVSGEALLDTAALMADLDLVVTIESMPAHLAGALGVPVLLALTYVADWRWLTERGDTPWYAGTKLFRQDQSRQWAPVFERIAQAVRERVALNGASATKH